jgi:hypothetical protein
MSFKVHKYDIDKSVTRWAIEFGTLKNAGCNFLVAFNHTVIWIFWYKK